MGIYIAIELCDVTLILDLISTVVQLYRHLGQGMDE